MLGSKAKRELQKNQRRICIDSIEIGISSPQQISTWGERRLPNGKKVGQVKNSKTVNYKRFTPLRDGLFCERIFGPVKTCICACGKRQPRSDITFCDKCEVEYTDQRARRYRLGHISLVSPVAHMWYLKGRPSYISLFLGKRKNRILQLAYANAYLVEQSFSSNSKWNLASLPSNIMTPAFERERHGASKYIQNIQSYLETRKTDQMFSHLKTNEINTSPYFEKKESPISFFSFFTEVLGYMKKDVVLINRSSVKNTTAYQLSVQKSFFDANYLLNISQSILSYPQKRLFFQLFPNHFVNRRINKTQNGVLRSIETRVLHKVEKKDKAFWKRDQLGDHSSLQLSQYIFYAKQRTPLFIKMSLPLGRIPQICSINMFSFVNILNRSLISPTLILLFKKLIFSLPNSFQTQDLLFSTVKRKQENNPVLKTFLRSLDFFEKETKDGKKHKHRNALQVEKIRKDARFSTFGTLNPIIGIHPYRSTQPFSQADNLDLRKKEETLIFNQLKQTRLLGLTPHSSEFLFQNKASLLATAQTPQKALNLYNRAYALPFLPSLVCTFQLRDELLNFVESSAFIEDKPIWMYCQLERWRPLRDVHKFMSEQMLSQSSDKMWGSSFDQADLKKRNLNGFQRVGTELWKSSPHHTFSSHPTLHKSLNTTKWLDEPIQGAFCTIEKGPSNSNLFHSQQSAMKKETFLTQNKKSERSVLSRKTNLSRIKQDNKIQKSFVTARRKRKVRTSFVSQNSQSFLAARLLPISKKKNRQNRMLEHLESLRYILYQALLEKNLSLQMERLHTDLLASTQKVSSVTPLSFAPEIPVEKPFPSRLRKYSLSFPEVSRAHSSFYKELARHMFFSRGIEAYLLFLGNRSKKAFHAHILIRSSLYQEVPSLIGLLGRLQLQSSEKSYRTFLLDKTWLRSFLIEKNIFQGEQQPFKTQSGLAFKEKIYKDILLSRNGLGSYSHSRFVSSLAHAFGELVGKKKQSSSFFQRYCASLWDIQKIGWDRIQVIADKEHLPNKRFVQKNASSMKNKSVQTLLESYERRFLHMVYNSFFVQNNSLTNLSLSYDVRYRSISPNYKQAFHSIHKNQYFQTSLSSKRDKESISTRALSFFLILPHIQSLHKNPFHLTILRSQNADISLNIGRSFESQMSKTPDFSFNAKSPAHFHSSTLHTSENFLNQSSIFQKKKAYSTALSPNSSNQLSLKEQQSFVSLSDGKDALYNNRKRKHFPQQFHGFFRGQNVSFSGENSTLSFLDATTIREILSYTGGGAIHKLLERCDMQLLKSFLFQDIQAARALYKKKISESDYPPSRVKKRVLTRLARRIFKNSRRLKLTQLLMRCKRRPEWMMISVLPVLPPDLRPILQMSEGVVAASDLNNLYQRVIYRNNRFHKLSFIDFHLVTAIQRLVQDAVDRLIENGKGGSKPFYTPAGRPLKSLSDTLKGKKGRFRLNLLGKRVDFSGRSVIVVSPHLQIHECGLPREIALELYDYFLLRHFMLKKKAASIVMAKKIMKERTPIVWDALRNIMYHHPVLLNRAPTLHRLGIQAFQPKLVRGNAILLHPLVCSGFNADFDGDQMGVHLPLSPQARAEAWDLLWARNNLLSPATGQPVLVPSQDMVLGFYYITQSLSSLFQQKRNLLLQYQDTNKHKKSQIQEVVHSKTYKTNTHTKPRILQNISQQYVFGDSMSLLQAFQNKYIQIHTPVWLQWTGAVENDETSQAPLELRLDIFGGGTYIYSKYKRRKDENFSPSQLYIRTTAGRVLLYSTLFEK